MAVPVMEATVPVPAVTFVLPMQNQRGAVYFTEPAEMVVGSMP